MATTNKFKFRKNDRIGDPSAEQDRYLENCFVDTGYLSILNDCSDPRAVIVGRTGSGKSALLCRLQDECPHCITLDLQRLALSYISGSTILTYFERELGVNLDLFYQSLWRHVFIVDLLKKHYNIQDAADRQRTIDMIMSQILQNKGRIEAFRYLNSWGDQFWTTSEERIREMTSYVENELQAGGGLNVAHVATLQAGGKITLSESQVTEIRHRGREIVNNVQMTHLSALMDALDKDILKDPKRRYYIIVDFLDEQWIGDENLRVWLIRGLIETVRDFNRKVRFAKILISIRLDLLRRVYRETSGSGFQEEKYEALNLAISWTSKELEQVLDLRVKELVKERYTSQVVRLRDILPARMEGKKGGQTGLDYLLERTLMRPRDAIQFLNACVEIAVGEPQITVAKLQQAEAKYSQQRRTALADEWKELYPYLVLLTDLLKWHGPRFPLGIITAEALDAMCVRISDEEKRKPHPQALDVLTFDRYLNRGTTAEELRSQLAQLFYTVGLVGIKVASHLETVWSSKGGPSSMNSAEVNDSSVIVIHKAFWRVLGVNPYGY